MTTGRLAALALTGALCASPVMAGEILKAVPTTLDPAKAYLLVTLKDMGRLAPHPGVWISRYDPEAKDIRGKPGSTAQPLSSGGDRGEFVSNKVSILRDGLARVHLIALEPGDYVIEGVEVAGAGGGTSYALGSHWVSLKPGVVADMGEGTIGQDFGQGGAAGFAMKMAFVPFSAPKAPAITVTFAPNETRGRAAVGQLPYEAAELKPGATFGNYMTGPIYKMDRPPAATQ